MKAEQKSTGFTQEDGHQLAVDMILEMQARYSDGEAGVSENEIAGLWRRSESKILRGYLDNVKGRASPELEHGFFAVLSDVLGASGECAQVDLEKCYLGERHGESSASTRPPAPETL